MAKKNKKSRKDEAMELGLSLLFDRIYMASHRAWKDLSSILTDMVENSKMPPESMRSLNLAIVTNLLRFYEECHNASFSSDRKKMDKLSQLSKMDEFMVNSMDRSLLERLEEYRVFIIKHYARWSAAT
jgi:hypothetical protein